jgi:catechol 2,3-dioxygenase-like lactoylglutathione lyase family enzyme
MVPIKVEFVYAGLRVRNLPRSLRFYRKLGFRIHKRGTMGHGGQWVHLAYQARPSVWS